MMQNKYVYNRIISLNNKETIPTIKNIYPDVDLRESIQPAKSESE
jgi:hypothetical protein